MNSRTPKLLPSKEYLDEVLRYDPETGFLYWKVRKPEHFTNQLTKRDSAWRARNINSRVAGERAFTCIMKKVGYHFGSLDGNQYLAHRIIFKMHHGYDPEQVDHINGIRTDNRIENLQSVSYSGNNKNQGLSVRNTSGVIGVSKIKKTNKWYASIVHEGKTISLGVYDDFEDAVKARREGEIKYNYSPKHGTRNSFNVEKELASAQA